MPGSPEQRQAQPDMDILSHTSCPEDLRPTGIRAYRFGTAPQVSTTAVTLHRSASIHQRRSDAPVASGHAPTDTDVVSDESSGDKEAHDSDMTEDTTKDSTDTNTSFTHIPTITSSFLRPGSKFRGTQQSDRQIYNVQVEIKYVDMEQSFVCGYLRIQGLTDDHPTLTTYFEGEIIGPKYTFATAHPEWGASEKVDMIHWSRFSAFRPLRSCSKSAGFSTKSFAHREHLFMRWKEFFLVPDHKVKTITGASFEGFYYICFNQCSGTISGIYFHAKSERYQQLELYHVYDHGCTGVMEFR